MSNACNWHELCEFWSHLLPEPPFRATGAIAPPSTVPAGDLNEGVVTIQSCDNVKFNIHRKNLETSTGAFPGGEFQTNGEAVHLTEKGDVLAILFQFIYPQRHPTLEGLDFTLLGQIAEAAEKYEVFAAMNISVIRLSEILPTHALDIFAHAIKHNYPGLVNRAAVSVARYPWATMTQRLPVVAIHPWAKYQECWAAVFNAGIAVLSGLKQDRQTCRYRVPQLALGGSSAEGPEAPVGEFICTSCFFMLKTWVMSLEKVPGSAADLSWAISHPGDLGGPPGRPSAPTASPFLPRMSQPGFQARGYRVSDMEGHCSTCPNHDAACIHLAAVQSALQDAVKKVPSFSTLF